MRLPCCEPYLQEGPGYSRGVSRRLSARLQNWPGCRRYQEKIVRHPPSGWDHSESNGYVPGREGAAHDYDEAGGTPVEASRG
jgi:hypothetical protein